MQSLIELKKLLYLIDVDLKIRFKLDLKIDYIIKCKSSLSPQ